MYTLFIVYILITVFICALIASKKFRKLTLIVVVAAILFAAVLTLHGAARAEEVQGVITRIAPDIFDNYPVLVVTVETFNGEVYTYFAEEEIDAQGIITLVLFGEEVVDVKEAF